LSGTQDTGKYFPTRNAKCVLEHEKTEIICGAEQTNGQGNDIKTSHYLFLFTIGAEACD
jgi:hypothetical protein